MDNVDNFIYFQNKYVMGGKMGKEIENKKQSGSFVGVKGKRKTIKLRSSESIMDGNSVQMPFLAPYKGDRLTYVEYEWNTIENGIEVKRGLNVNGHGKLGVPTLREREVLRALQDIYIWNKIEEGVLELETDRNKITEEDLMIDFKTIDNLATELGYKKISGQQRKSIKESIEILVASTMFNTHEGGIYDPTTKKYITNSKESYRYLEDMKDYTVYDCENCLFLNGCRKDFNNCLSKSKKTDVTKIKMSMQMYLSIANNYRLYYDKNNAKEIKNLIAKNIYMISRKWIGDGYISKANIQKYMDRIPMNAKKEKHRKQAIKDSIALLDKYDFVEAYVENDIVTVIHLDKKPTTNKEVAVDKIETDGLYLKNKYNTFKEFKQELIKQGYTENEFDELIDKRIEQIKYLQALLRYVMLKHKYNSTIVVKDYYNNCLNMNNGKGMELDKKYFID